MGFPKSQWVVGSCDRWEFPPFSEATDCPFAQPYDTRHIVCHYGCARGRNSCGYGHANRRTATHDDSLPNLCQIKYKAGVFRISVVMPEKICISNRNVSSHWINKSFDNLTNVYQTYKVEGMLRHVNSKVGAFHKSTDRLFDMKTILQYRKNGEYRTEKIDIFTAITGFCNISTSQVVW